MFSNLSWYEVVALLLLALFIFGDKLPKVIGDGLRMLRNLRRMAQNATTDLSQELGTDIQLDDLNPRTFVRKHVLSEADQQKLLSPLKGVSDDLAQQTRGVQQEFQDAGRLAGQVRRSASWRTAMAGPSTGGASTAAEAGGGSTAAEAGRGSATAKAAAGPSAGSPVAVESEAAEPVATAEPGSARADRRDYEDVT